MRKVKISVIVPVYNVEKYLKQCLDSLLSQSFTDFEIICVNDGSTDASPDILKKYADKDKRIRIINQPTQTVGAARNNGLKKAKGKYIICLDSDDFFEKEMLSKLFDKAEKTSADIVLFQFRIFDMNSGKYSEPRGLQKELVNNFETFCVNDIPDCIMAVTKPNTWTKLYRAKFIKRNHLKYPLFPNAEDEYFTYYSLCLAKKITYIEDTLVNYRVGRKDSLESKKDENPLCFIEADRALYDDLNKKGIYQKVQYSFANRVVDHFTYALWKMKSSPEALSKVKDAMKNDFFPYTGVLNYPDKIYDNIENTKKLRQL